MISMIPVCCIFTSDSIHRTHLCVTIRNKATYFYDNHMILC